MQFFDCADPRYATHAGPQGRIARSTGLWRPEFALDDVPEDPLLSTYLARRDELIGYFKVRLGSEDAARDIVQDIYIRILERPPEPVTHPAALLYRIGTNLMLDRIKMARRRGQRDAVWRQSTTHSVGAEDIAREVPADEVLASRQRLAKIAEVVRTLPPQAQQAFRLHKIEGLSHAETAAAMGVSRSSVEKYIMLCLKRIVAEVGR
ncbi:MAG: sigma-70 family RNA polymerase sigma factor [Proteobacteria bacterium]|nr:sigma-70 family RNA polymerase sigma factor [Pseudomonadota bacterium]